MGLSDAQFAALQVSPTSLVPTSDIAAISQNAGPALQGTVTFSPSGVNPSRGLVELPQNVVNPQALIAANPCVLGTQSAFAVTGEQYRWAPTMPSAAILRRFRGWKSKEEGRRKKKEGKSCPVQK